jgi:hypothetical protein
MARWRDGEMRCDVMRRIRRTSFPFFFSSLFLFLFSTSSLSGSLHLYPFHLHLLHHHLPSPPSPSQRPPQNANPCSQVPLPSFPTLARHETHYRSTLQPRSCLTAFLSCFCFYPVFASLRPFHCTPVFCSPFLHFRFAPAVLLITLFGEGIQAALLSLR